MSLATLEGRLTVRLGARGATLASAQRPQAARLFAGRGAQEVLTLLPTLYAVCGWAHLAAASAAMQAARGEALRPQQQLARDTVVDGEALREHLLRILLGWSAALEHRVHPEILRDVMRLPERLSSALGTQWCVLAAADRARPAAGETAAALTGIDALIERQILGCPPGEWRRLASVDAALGLSGSRALGPRFLQWLVDQGHAGVGAAMLPALPEFTRHGLVACFEEDFPGTNPQWQGLPCETGAYARQHTHPLVVAFSARWGHGLIARSVARLVEIARLAERLHAAVPGPVSAFADGATGFGVVETARGRLAHRVRLQGDRVEDARILAPTDWNCHPRGVMAACLGALPCDARARQRAALVVECIDPCVAYVIEDDSHA